MQWAGGPDSGRASKPPCHIDAPCHWLFVLSLQSGKPIDSKDLFIHQDTGRGHRPPSLSALERERG